MYESYGIISATCIAILITVIVNIIKKDKFTFRGKVELKWLIYSLIVVFISKELQYIFTYLYSSRIIPYKIFQTIFISLYYIVYSLPLVTITCYLFKCIGKKLTKLKFFFLITPALIMVILSVMSIFVPLIFSVSDEGVLLYGPLYPYLAIMSFGYMILDIFCAVKFKDRLEKGCFITFISMFIAPFGALLVFYVIIFILQEQSMSLIWIALVITLTIHYFSFIQEILVTTDRLTSLPSKDRLINYLDILLRSKKRENIYGIMLDLDHFKDINDTHGHTVGDVALKKAADLLVSISPSEAFVSRFAGDEFVIIYSSNDEKFIEGFEKSLKEKEAEFNNSKENAFALNFSFGYFLFDKKEEYDVSTFLKIIDKNMYENKRNK